MGSVRKFLCAYGVGSKISEDHKQNKNLLNAAFRISKAPLAPSLIFLDHKVHPGSYVWSMSF